VKRTTEATDRAIWVLTAEDGESQRDAQQARASPAVVELLEEYVAALLASRELALT
jgi:hypothetical protein